MKQLLLWLFLMVSLFAESQINTPEVVSSAGGYFNQNNGSLSWTLGELTTEFASNTDSKLTQGFQQGNFNVLTVRNNEKPFDIKIWPNPTFDLVNIDLKDLDFNLNVQLIDSKGSIVFNKSFNNQTEIKIDITNKASGLYNLVVSSSKSNYSKSFKIQKLN